MTEICLLIIAIACIAGAVANIVNLVITHKVLGKQILQAGEDVRFQRDVAQKNYLDALKWKELATLNAAKAEGGAFDTFVNELRNDYHKADKNSERAKVIAGLLTKMDEFTTSCRVENEQ